MADNVLGSISITITGDSSQLNAALNQSVAGARAAGSQISQALNDGARGSDKIVSAIGLLAGVIERESAAATLAAQRNSAMAASLQQVQSGASGAAQGFTQLGNSSTQATYGLRYMIFGLKDIGEGRYRFALAELVNVILRLGPAAIIAGAAIAAIGATVYAFTELKNSINDAKDASENAFSTIVRGAQKANDELDVSILKLENEIAQLEHKPVNRAAEALAEIKVQADNSTDSLLKMLAALKEATEKQVSGSFGFGTGEISRFVTRQASPQPINDLEKNAQRQIGVLEKGRQSELDNASADQAQQVNKKWDAIVNERINAFKRLADAEVQKQVRPSGPQSPADQALERYFPKDTGELEKAANAFKQGLSAEQEKTFKEETKLSDEQKKQGLEDAKKGVEDARALAVARIQAQEKALEEGSALDKRYSDSAIEVSHAQVQAQIAAMVDRRAAAVSEAEEELRVATAHQAQITEDLRQNTAARISLIRAQGAAEGQGKTGTERQTIGVKTEEKVSEVNTKAVQEESVAGAAVAAAQYRVQAELASTAREKELDALKEIAKQLDENNSRVTLYKNLSIQLKEISEKGSGQEGELKGTGQKLAAEREYALEAAHTNQQQVEYAVQIASIEERARQAKISGLQKDLSTANSAVASPESSDQERESQAKRAGQLEVQIADLQQQSANANFAAQTKILETIQSQNQALQAQKTILDALTNWSQISVGTAANQFAGALVEIPQKIGNSLAASIFDKPKKGESKGQEIGQGLAKTGESAAKDVAGKLFTAAIEKLVAQLVGQAAIGALQSSITTANTAAVSALTFAVAAQTEATWSSIALLGFAGGGDPATDRPFLAGERGAELIHPKGQALTVVPAGRTKQIMDALAGQSVSAPAGVDFALPGAPNSQSQITNTSSASLSRVTNHNTGQVGDTNFNIYGARDPRETMRQIADYQKRQTGKFSPANS